MSHKNGLMKHRRYFFILLLSIFSSATFPHGYVGKRFFPSTISLDEPFINDKIALPIFYSESPAANDKDTWTTNPKLEYSKTITKHFQASATASYLHMQTQGENTQNGFDDWLAGVRYNLFLAAATESIFSVALNATIGGTGSHLVNATSHTTLSPEVLFAQGMGPLPESLKFLRPLGLSFSLSPNIITTNYTVSSISWGLAAGYSLPYLQQYVANFNIPLLNHIVPIVELPFNTCTQGNCHGQTTGTIDPGVIMYGRYGQIGIEALIPANHNTGSKVGGVIQFYLYLDTLFPNSLGKPIIAA